MTGRSAARPRSVVATPIRIGEVERTGTPRLSSGVSEFDRVLGGGFVPGSLVLLGGEPGIGKSTLVLQALAEMSQTSEVLLITGEESVEQVASRAERLGGDCSRVGVLAETGLEAIIAAIQAHRPTICAIDSIQTLRSEALESAPGSVAQVREATAALVRLAKEGGTTILLVGQVTKDGGLAGPRLLEHMVDCVLGFEGDELRAYRVLRATKNRFGSTNETGVFEMRADGLACVDDPTSLFLAEVGDRVGSCVFPAIEGSRALLVEVQALVGPTEVVPPRRVAVGVDRTRLAQLIAVLSRHAGLRLGDQDVFVSVAGGARAMDPAADLAIALAVSSAHRGVPLASGLAAFGEIGLTGSIRPVGHVQRRLGAAARHGTLIAVTPRMAGDGEPHEARLKRVEAVSDIREAIDLACAA